jgi:hypothetical protein
VIAYGTQCRHELALDGCFVLKKWDERWFQAPAVNLPDLKMSFNGNSCANLDVGMDATYKKAIDDTSLSLSTSVAQTDITTGDTNECLFVCGDDSDDSHVATEMNVDSDDDTRTLASLRNMKPAAKQTYKYKYSSFMEDCTKLATAVQNRPTVAEAVHGTIVTLMRLAQGQDCDIDHRTFHEIIEGARTTFGANKRIHSVTNFLSTQAGEQQMPISANPGGLGGPLMTGKRSYTEGKPPIKGSDEKPDCGFCYQKGHNIVSCTELKKYGECIKSEQELQCLVEDLLIADGLFPATHITCCGEA